MDVDPFKDYVLEQLRCIGDVRCRGLFRSHGLYFGIHFFGIIWHGRLFFKTTHWTRARYLEHHMRPFAEYGGRFLSLFYEVPRPVIDNAHELCTWARDAIAIKDKGSKDFSNY